MRERTRTGEKERWSKGREEGGKEGRRETARRPSVLSPLKMF